MKEYIYELITIGQFYGAGILELRADLSALCLKYLSLILYDMGVLIGTSFLGMSDVA